MDAAADELLRLAFDRAPAARGQPGHRAHPRPGGRRALRRHQLRARPPADPSAPACSNALPRLVDYLESSGAKLPHCGGVFLFRLLRGHAPLHPGPGRGGRSCPSGAACPWTSSRSATGPGSPRWQCGPSRRVIPSSVMSTTERLYYADPFLHRFTGRVVAHGTWSGAPSVVLDRTAFYPEAGGQMADRGVLGGLPVRDVQVDDAGAVHHVLDVRGHRAPRGRRRAGRASVDRARRRVHMALHTGQHMLSRALVDVAGAATVSSRLGETLCTIDVDLRRPGRAAASPRPRTLVNAIIDDDIAHPRLLPHARGAGRAPAAPRAQGDGQHPRHPDWRLRRVPLRRHALHAHRRRWAWCGCWASSATRARAASSSPRAARARRELWEEAGDAARAGPGLHLRPAGCARRRGQAAPRADRGARGARRRPRQARRARRRRARRRRWTQSPDKRVVAVLDGADARARCAPWPRASRPGREAVVLLAGRSPEGLAVLITRGQRLQLRVRRLPQARRRGRRRPWRRPPRARRGTPAARAPTGRRSWPRCSAEEVGAYPTRARASRPSQRSSSAFTSAWCSGPSSRGILRDDAPRLLLRQRQQISIARQVRHRQLRQAALPRAEELARPADLQVLLRDHEAVAAAAPSPAAAPRRLGRARGSATR